MSTDFDYENYIISCSFTHFDSGEILTDFFLQKKNSCKDDICNGKTQGMRMGSCRVRGNEQPKGISYFGEVIFRSS